VVEKKGAGHANSELMRCSVDDSDKAKIEEVETSLLQSEEALPSEGLILSDLEETLESIIRSYGHADPWELSAPLAKANMPPDALTSLLNQLDPRNA